MTVIVLKSHAIHYSWITNYVLGSLEECSRTQMANSGLASQIAIETNSYIMLFEWIIVEELLVQVS